MIRITCTHCRQVLTIDEGFAGGVCRCQHCGTIQTVPSAKPATRSGGGGIVGSAAKTLYRSAERGSRPPRDASQEHPLSDSTLEELAQIVSSSGLQSQSRRLRQPPIPGAASPAFTMTPPRKKLSLPLLVATAIILILLLIIVLLLLRHPANQAAPSAASSAPPAVVAATPNFAAMTLDAEDTVVYLLDDGGSASDILPAMEAICFQSIKSLGPQRRFKVIFWRDGSPMYPLDGTTRATDDEERNCESALRDNYAQGSTTIDSAFKLAVGCHPDAIVVVTAKAEQLPDDFSETILTMRGDSNAKVYTVGVNGDSTTDTTKLGELATIAAHTGGQFLNISSSDLNRLAH